VATRARTRLLFARLHGPGDGRFHLKLLLPFLGLFLGACPAPAARLAGTLIVVDDAGDSVRLAAPAARIVSLSPATTELLFAIGAGDRLVGRTRWCDYPAAARAVESVGDGMPPNVEAVLARHPDLVLLYRSSQNAEALRQFRTAGVATLQLSMDHLADVGRLARLLGTVVGRSAAGDSLAAAFTAALDSAAAPGAMLPASARRRVLLLAWDQPPIAIGAGSFQSEILTLAGGSNLFADLAVPSATVSIEAIAARDPDLILVTDSGPPAIMVRPEWRVVGAVRERRFLHLATPAFSRPGPRAPAVVRMLNTALEATRP
jgi:iron complex transport system substrate-binding protein